MVMAMLGYDFLTATSAVVTALSNVGPRLGTLIGPGRQFSSLAAPELYLLSVMMLLGRLEVLTVLVILTPGLLAPLKLVADRPLSRLDTGRQMPKSPRANQRDGDGHDRA